MKTIVTSLVLAASTLAASAAEPVLRYEFCPDRSGREVSWIEIGQDGAYRSYLPAGAVCSGVPCHGLAEGRLAGKQMQALTNLTSNMDQRWVTEASDYRDSGARFTDLSCVRLKAGVREMVWTWLPEGWDPESVRLVAVQTAFEQLMAAR